MEHVAQKMLKVFRYPVSVVVVSLLMCGIVTAQEPPTSEISRYRQDIQVCSQALSDWQWQAKVQIDIVIAVILFGALVTIFQGLNKGWCKPATLVLGAAITILTSINAKVFSADYRVLQQAAIDGRDLIEQMNITVENLGLQQADVAGLRTQWLKLRTQFSGLQKSVLLGTNKTGAFIIWGRLVYAQSSRPTWTYSTPTDIDNLYYMGMSENNSITEAREQSFNNAVTVGATSLSAIKGTNLEALRKLIASSSVIDKSYYEYDKTRGVYRYYTLVRISADVKKFIFPVSTTKGSKTVLVSGKTPWTDTGIQISKADTISFTATGQVQWGVGKSKLVGPEGSTQKIKANALRTAYPVSTLGAGGLIAKVGSGRALAVGKTAKIVASESGTLYLGINDNSFRDNSGQFSVSVVWSSGMNR